MKKYIFRFRYELALFSFFIIEMLTKMPVIDGMDNWSVSQYLLTYRLGFSSRMLIGSIISLFTNKITDTIIYNIATGTSVLLCLFVAIILAHFIKKTNRASNYIKVIVLIFIASPASITYLFNSANFSRFDIYLLLISMAYVLISKTKFKWAIPLMCIVAMSIHQVFIFTFFPMVIIVLLYNASREKSKIQSTILITTTSFFTACAFLLFQFVKVIRYANIDALIQEISSYTNVKPSTLLSYDYFFAINDHI